MEVSLIIIWMTGYFAYPFSWVIFVRGLSISYMNVEVGCIVPSFWSCIVCMYWWVGGILHCSVICSLSILQIVGRQSGIGQQHWKREYIVLANVLPLGLSRNCSCLSGSVR